MPLSEDTRPARPHCPFILRSSCWGIFFLRQQDNGRPFPVPPPLLSRRCLCRRYRHQRSSRRRRRRTALGGRRCSDTRRSSLGPRRSDRRHRGSCCRLLGEHDQPLGLRRRGGGLRRCSGRRCCRRRRRLLGGQDERWAAGRTVELRVGRWCRGCCWRGWAIFHGRCRCRRRCSRWWRWGRSILPFGRAVLLLLHDDRCRRRRKWCCLRQAVLWWCRHWCSDAHPHLNVRRWSDPRCLAGL